MWMERAGASSSSVGSLWRSFVWWIRCRLVGKAIASKTISLRQFDHILIRNPSWWQNPILEFFFFYIWFYSRESAGTWQGVGVLPDYGYSPGTMSLIFLWSLDSSFIFRKLSSKASSPPSRTFRNESRKGALVYPPSEFHSQERRIHL